MLRDQHANFRYWTQSRTLLGLVVSLLRPGQKTTHRDTGLRPRTRSANLSKLAETWGVVGVILSRRSAISQEERIMKIHGWSNRIQCKIPFFGVEAKPLPTAIPLCLENQYIKGIQRTIRDSVTYGLRILDLRSLKGPKQKSLDKKTSPFA